MSKQIFYITGCHRSGTTLMRLILDCHERIYCFDERESYGILSRGPNTHGCDYTHHTHVGYKVPRFAEQLFAEKPFDYDSWGMPSPLAQFYRYDPVIFMVRDYRDVVVSMSHLKLIDDTPWLVEWCIPMISFKMRYDPSFRKRWQREIALASAHTSMIGWGALFWAYKNTALLDYLQRAAPVLPVQYEHLVTNPEAVIRQVCTHLGVEFQPSMLAHATRAHTGLEPGGLAIGNTDPQRPIDARGVGQWASGPRALSGADVALADAIAGPTLAELTRVCWPAD